MYNEQCSLQTIHSSNELSSINSIHALTFFRDYPQHCMYKIEYTRQSAGNYTRKRTKINRTSPQRQTMQLRSAL